MYGMFTGKTKFTNLTFLTSINLLQPFELLIQIFPFLNHQKLNLCQVSIKIQNSVFFAILQILKKSKNQTVETGQLGKKLDLKTQKGLVRKRPENSGLIQNFLEFNSPNCRDAFFQSRCVSAWLHSHHWLAFSVTRFFLKNPPTFPKISRF